MTTNNATAPFAARTGSDFPTDDSPKSVRYRMDAVYNGIQPTMPGLASMTKKQMASSLQSIWTVCDETGVQRRNETSPQHKLTIYGRVLSAIQNGSLDKPSRLRLAIARTTGGEP